MFGEVENWSVNDVRKFASAHDDDSGESNSGFTSVDAGVPHASPTVRSVVVPSPAVGWADSVSFVMSPAFCGAPVLSKNTTRTVCAFASLNASSTKAESGVVLGAVSSTNSYAFHCSLPLAVVTLSVDGGRTEGGRDLQQRREQRASLESVVAAVASLGSIDVDRVEARGDRGRLIGGAGPGAITAGCCQGDRGERGQEAEAHGRTHASGYSRNGVR